MRPDVWAPTPHRVDLVLADGDRIPLVQRDDGWWEGGPELGPGTRYGFSLDGGDPLPDPRSRWQPDGVHGLSAVAEDAFDWTDGDWPGLELLGGVIYELHVGTFTPEGTLDAAISRLDHLRGLGVAAVELLPVAEAMGERGWGYDGVDLWSVHHAYGGPDALRRFTDAAHRTGLGVLLDVVYNHLGPEGAYLQRFGPYFTDLHQTPWGPAVNLDGPGSTEVRRFIVENALHWCDEHHVDGLRIDAVHALIDERPVHVVAELASAVHELGARDGRRRWVIVEREQADHLPLRDPAQGGWGVDARWADDLHHALHALLTGERTGYYAPFGRLADVATVLRHGHLPPGEPLDDEIAAHRLVTCAQNHDQIGNRPGGERLSELAGLDPAMAAAALVLLGPGTPLVFQGEEWAATAGFPFFCDTPDPDLAATIRRGRLAELEPLGWDADAFLDPLDPATFTNATLDWAEPDQEPHHTVLEWYRTLIHLRREHPEPAAGATQVDVDESARTLVLRRGAHEIACNFGTGDVQLELPDRAVVACHGRAAVGPSSVVLGPGATAVLRCDAPR
jgi:maltooligosyltrehalose trehalohydrolase